MNVCFPKMNGLPDQAYFYGRAEIEQIVTWNHEEQTAPGIKRCPWIEFVSKSTAYGQHGIVISGPFFKGYTPVLVYLIGFAT